MLWNITKTILLARGIFALASHVCDRRAGWFSHPFFFTLLLVVWGSKCSSDARIRLLDHQVAEKIEHTIRHSRVSLSHPYSPSEKHAFAKINYWQQMGLLLVAPMDFVLVGSSLWSQQSPTTFGQATSIYKEHCASFRFVTKVSDSWEPIDEPIQCSYKKGTNSHAQSNSHGAL